VLALSSAVATLLWLAMSAQYKQQGSSSVHCSCADSVCRSAVCNVPKQSSSMSSGAVCCHTLAAVLHMFYEPSHSNAACQYAM
jgi:hypothetical protein